MIKLATVFSGIGAIEHALDRMGLQHQKPTGEAMN